MRLERRGSGVGAGTGAGDGGSWAEVKDTGFGAEADACQRERPTREAYERGIIMRYISIRHTPIEMHAYEICAHPCTGNTSSSLGGL